MIGTSLPEYLFILVCITALRLVAPVSIAYLAYSAYIGECWGSGWIAAFATVEATFYIAIFIPRSISFQQPTPTKNAPTPLTREQRKAMFQQCASAVPGENYPMGWFLSPEVTREDVRSWLLWALFSSRPEDARQEWEAELEGYLQEIERVIGREFESGESRRNSSIRLAFDAVRTVHRPLIWYMTVGLVDSLVYLRLKSLGFIHHAHSTWATTFPPRPFTVFSQGSATQHFSYWYRPHKSTTKVPILFIHGIGIGLYPYVSTFQDLLKADPDVGIILIELLPISFHMTAKPVPSKHIMLDAISDVLSSLGITRTALAAHSFGTVIAAHILHSHTQNRTPMIVRSSTSEQTPLLMAAPGRLSSKITSIVFVDPIPILLHLPDVAYNFLYRRPRSANEWQLWYFASRDPDVARTLSRYFFWHECLLWREDLLYSETDATRWPGKIGIVLSGSDQIIASSRVWSYLTSGVSLEEANHWVSPEGKLEVLYRSGLDHAMVFDSADRRQPLTELLERFCKLE